MIYKLNFITKKNKKIEFVFQHKESYSNEQFQNIVKSAVSQTVRMFGEFDLYNFKIVMNILEFETNMRMVETEFSLPNSKGEFNY